MAVLATLAITPLRWVTGWAWLLRLRRMLGLYAFFYGTLHVTAYVWIDHWFDWAEILGDIAKRPYLTFGFVAYVLMIPLAVTSTNAMVRRLGGRNWQRLHRLRLCDRRARRPCTSGITSWRRTTSPSRRIYARCLARCSARACCMAGRRTGVRRRARHRGAGIKCGRRARLAGDY